MAPTRRTTAPSAPRLSEVARHVIYPKSRIVESLWVDVESQCADFGDVFDEWQRGAGTIILGLDKDGIFTATIGGVTLSIPRQVAKTFLVGRIIFALCVLSPGLKVIWTAHRTRTTTNTFKSLQGYAKRPKVAPHIAPNGIRTTNGEQEIRFLNGSIIMFGAREQGFGRGFDEVDIEVFDEAQILTEKALEDMVAATNQSRHPHGALLFYMGTPPRPVDPGEVFKARRQEALEQERQTGESEDAVYIECSADPDADPDDRTQWAKANPSFPKRTPLRSMLRLRKNLVSVESWLREALGVWDDDALRSDQPYSVEQYDAACIDRARKPGRAPVVFAVDLSWDRSTAHVAAAWFRKGGKPYVQEIARMAPRDLVVWLPAKVTEYDPLAICLQGGSSPSNGLGIDLSRAGVALRVLNGTEVAAGCGRFADRLTEGSLCHPVEAEIRTAVEQAVKKLIGDGWVIDRKKSPVDVAGLVAQTEAVWLLEDIVGSADYDTDDSVY